MALTESIEMHPGPPSAMVLPKFYGGPLDGSTGQATEKDSIKGSIRMTGGVYSLQGFRNSAPGANEFLKQFSFDYAIYEWEYA